MITTQRFFVTETDLDKVPSLYPAEYHQPVYDPKSCHAPTNPESSHIEEGMVLTVEPGM
jgi:Xaa-Pro dipeptidase